MPKVSMKRQITLPIEQCKKIGIKAGDEYESYVYENRITIIKKTKGAAKGMLKDIVIDESMTDSQSLQSAL
ncbi:MAG: AbrB/MazE/SpoVT family DNA-binding domain-containing protein [Alcanivoracaceae bacterium]|nr:AbrB/MazE/SpoVT family DNA-binding domain-containing protein [Alcanivoracaceae bacterium]